MVAAVLAVSVVLRPARGHRRARALMAKDQTQLREIQMSQAVLARDFGSQYPLPSLAPRALPGQPEDFTLNHTANIYSMLVMADYFGPEVLVSPVETAP